MRIVEYPAIPYETSIHNGFNQGATIEIHGTPFQGRTQMFTINLRSREGIAMHFTVRMGAFGEHAVVLNNERYTRWQSEQRIQNPFRYGQKFELQLINMQNSLTFYLNGSPLTHFHHRESPNNITSLEISGDINVERLVLDKMSENYKTPNVDVHTDVLSVSLAQTHITSTMPGQPYPAGTVYREANSRAPYTSNRPPNTQPATYNPYREQSAPYSQPPPQQPTYNPYQNQGPQLGYQSQYQQQNSYGQNGVYRTESPMMVRSASPTRVYVQEQAQEKMVIEHQYPIQREAQQTNVYVQQQNQGSSVTVQSEGPTSVYYEQEAQSRAYPNLQMGPPPIGVSMPQAPPVYMSQAQPTQVYDQQSTWGYTRSHAPSPVVIESVPPPLYVRQAAPPPVVIRQRAPSPVIIERQAPTTVVYTERPPSPTRIVVTTQKPCKTAIVAEGVHSLVDAIADAVQSNKKRCN